MHKNDVQEFLEDEDCPNPFSSENVQSISNQSNHNQPDPGNFSINDTPVSEDLESVNLDDELGNEERKRDERE